MKFLHFILLTVLLTPISQKIGFAQTDDAESSKEVNKEESSSDRASSERWRAGVHYSILAPRAPTSALPGRVELREVFMYTSPLCAQLQPYLEQWLKRKPSYVDYVRSPAVVFPHARLQARMYFTLKRMGSERLHRDLFQWVHDAHHYPTYLKHFDTFDTIPHSHQEAHRNLNLQFAKVSGLDEKRFLEVYDSVEIDEAVFRAQMETSTYHVYGTSTFVINGKYSTSVQRFVNLDDKVNEKNFRELFSLVEYLVALEAPKQDK